MLMPKIEEVRAKYGKRIRADPVAQHFAQGDIRLVGDMDALVREWTTWQSGSRESPGRIDATVYLAQGLIKGRALGPTRIVEPPRGQSIYAELSDWETHEMF